MREVLQMLGVFLCLIAMVGFSLLISAGGASMDAYARPPNPAFVEWHQMVGPLARDAGMP